MSNDKFITIIVPASANTHLRKAGEILGIETNHMYITELSATGASPASHYISSGLIYPRFFEAVQTGDTLYDFIVERTDENGNTNPYTRSEIKLAHSKCDISTDDPRVTVERLGLQFVANESIV